MMIEARPLFDLCSRVPWVAFILLAASNERGRCFDLALAFIEAVKIASVSGSIGGVSREGYAMSPRRGSCRIEGGVRDTAHLS